MKKKVYPVAAATALLVVVVVAIAGFVLVRKYTPNK